MKGMTLDEFEETLAEGWEIDFTVGEMNYHYQRSGEDGVFRLSLSSDLETLFEAETSDVGAAVGELMALGIRNGKTIGQLESEITVISSS